MDVAIVVAMGLIFVVWAVFLYRFLLALQRDAQAASGRSLPDPGSAFSAFTNGLGNPRYRRQRNIVIAVTVLLFATILLARLTAA